VVALIRQVIEEVLPTLTRHTVTYSGSDMQVLVDGDELRLFQVLNNLLQNAIKYSPAGGVVQVQVERQDAMVRVAVSDEGIGIPQMELPQLFQRFYRASNVDEQKVSGFGVGLYLVKEIVTLHGGTVDVVSEEGHGSTFIITLPLLENQAPAQASSMITTGDVASENAQIPAQETATTELEPS
jgi:signal transduction histidine kinase